MFTGTPVMNNNARKDVYCSLMQTIIYFAGSLDILHLGKHVLLKA